jgi:hypothetical protein
MPDSPARALAAADPAGFRTALTFNHAPATYADPARVAALDPALRAEEWARLMRLERLSARLSRRLLRAAGLDQEECWAFPPRRRLAFLAAAELRRMAFHAGALLHASAVQHVIAKADRAALIGRIGADAYEFAVRRAAFLPLPLKRAQPADLATAIEADGLGCLAAWLASEPRAVAERVRLKLAPAPALDTPDPTLLGEGGLRTLRLVLTRGDPAWLAYSG